MIGAAGLGDIGQHFPDTDPQYKNISSRLLLKSVMRLLTQQKYTIVGMFNTLMTWMQPILSENGVTEEQSGMIGALMIIFGVVGSILLPLFSDKIGKRKPFILSICFFSMILIYLFTHNAHLEQTIIYGSMLGFVFLPGYAFLLIILEETIEVKLIGIATGLLMMMGNAGGVIFGIITQQLTSLTQHWSLAILFMMMLMLLSFILSFALKESFVYRNKESSCHDSIDANIAM